MLEVEWEEVGQENASPPLIGTGQGRTELELKWSAIVCGACIVLLVARVVVDWITA